MNRRGFFKTLAGTAAVVAAGIALPELDLWTPSRKFFLPPAGGWRGNSLLTCSQITNEALRILSNELQVGDYITIAGDRRRFQIRAVAASTVNVRYPPRYMPQVQANG